MAMTQGYSQANKDAVYYINLAIVVKDSEGNPMLDAEGNAVTLEVKAGVPITNYFSKDKPIAESFSKVTDLADIKLDLVGSVRSATAEARTMPQGGSLF